MTTRSDDTLPRDVAVAFARLDLRREFAPAVGFGAATVTGPRHTENEDAWGRRRGTTFVVADGMGGRPHGALAASTAVAVLLDELSGPVTVDWDRCISRANQAVIAAGERVGEDRIGTTFTLLRCVGARVTIVHLGDSRAYRLRHGAARCLTTDHNVRAELVAAGLDPARAGATSHQLAGLTGYLGDDTAWRRYEARSLLARPGDRFVLTTDGLHERLGGWDMGASGSCQQAADELVRAVAADATDDATALVIDVRAPEVDGLGTRHE